MQCGSNILPQTLVLPVYVRSSCTCSEVANYSSFGRIPSFGEGGIRGRSTSLL